MHNLSSQLEWQSRPGRRQAGAELVYTSAPVILLQQSSKTTTLTWWTTSFFGLRAEIHGGSQLSAGNHQQLRTRTRLFPAVDVRRVSSGRVICRNTCGSCRIPRVRFGSGIARSHSRSRGRRRLRLRRRSWRRSREERGRQADRDHRPPRAAEVATRVAGGRCRGDLRERAAGWRLGAQGVATRYPDYPRYKGAVRRFFWERWATPTMPRGELEISRDIASTAGSSRHQIAGSTRIESYVRA